MKNRLFRSIALLLVMALFFSACGKREEPESADSSADTGLVRSDRHGRQESPVTDPFTDPDIGIGHNGGDMEEQGEGSIKAVLYGNTVLQISYTAPFVSEITPVRDPLEYFYTDEEYNAFYEQFYDTQFYLFLSSGDETQDTFMNLYSDTRYFDCGIKRDNNGNAYGEVLICPVVNGNTITFTITDKDIAYSNTAHSLHNATLEDLCAQFRQATVYYNDRFICLLDFARAFEARPLADLPEIPEEQRLFFNGENKVVIGMDYITEFTERVSSTDVKIYDAGDNDYYITISGELGREYFNRSAFDSRERYIYLYFMAPDRGLYYDLSIGGYYGVDLSCWEYTNGLDSYYVIPESEYYCCTEYEDAGFIEVHINLKKHAEWIDSFSADHPYVVDNYIMPEIIPSLKAQVNALAKGADVFFKDYSTVNVSASWNRSYDGVTFKNNEGQVTFAKEDVVSAERILPERQFINICPESPKDSEFFKFDGQNFRVCVAELENVPALAPEWCTDTYRSSLYGNKAYCLYGITEPKRGNIIKLNKITVVVYTEYDSSGKMESGKVKVIYDNPADAKNVLSSSYVVPAEYGEENTIMPEFIDALFSGADKRYASPAEDFAGDFAENGASDKYVFRETYEQGFWGPDCIPEYYKKTCLESGMSYDYYYPEMKYLATDNGVRYFELTDEYLNMNGRRFEDALPPVILSNVFSLQDSISYCSYRSGHVIKDECTHKFSEYYRLFDQNTYELPVGVEDEDITVKVSTYSTLAGDIRDAYPNEVEYTDEEWLSLDITKELQELFPGVTLKPDRDNVQYENSINAIIPDGTPELMLSLVYAAKKAGYGNGSDEYNEEYLCESNFDTSDYKYYTYDEFISGKNRVDTKMFRYVGFITRPSSYDCCLFIEYLDRSEYKPGIRINFSN